MAQGTSNLPLRWRNGALEHWVRMQVCHSASAFAFLTFFTKQGGGWKHGGFFLALVSIRWEGPLASVCPAVCQGTKGEGDMAAAEISTNAPFGATPPGFY